MSESTRWEQLSQLVLNNPEMDGLSERDQTIAFGGRNRWPTDKLFTTLRKDFRDMKHLNIILAAAVAFGMTAYCGGDEESTVEESVTGCSITPGSERSIEAGGQRPQWVSSPILFGNIGGEKYALFYGKGEGKTEQTASENANGDAKAKAAESLKTLVLSQFARAWETYGDAESEQREQITKGMQAYKSKVEIGGLVTLGAHTEKIEVIDEVNEDCSVAKQHYKYQVYSLQGIDYKTYQQLRKKYIEGFEADNGPQINETQKKLLKEAEAALSKLDEEPGDALPEANLG